MMLSDFRSYIHIIEIEEEVNGLKQSYFKNAITHFPESDLIYPALLAVANHPLAHGLVMTRGKSVLFYGKDCFVCRTPHRAL